MSLISRLWYDRWRVDFIFLSRCDLGAIRRNPRHPAWIEPADVSGANRRDMPDDGICANRRSRRQPTLFEQDNVRRCDLLKPMRSRQANVIGESWRDWRKRRDLRRLKWSASADVVGAKWSCQRQPKLSETDEVVSTSQRDLRRWIWLARDIVIASTLLDRRLLIWPWLCRESRQWQHKTTQPNLT